MATYFLFILGFPALIKGADFLVNGAVSVARRLRVSELAIGLTLVAVGTSLPEFSIGIIGSMKGTGEIVIGNILGSNIVNLLMILGVASIIYPLRVRVDTIRREIPFGLFGAVMLLVLANDGPVSDDAVNALSRTDGLTLIAFMALFAAHIVTFARREKKKLEIPPTGERGVIYSSASLVAGVVLLALGGKWIVDGAVALASVLGVSRSFVGLAIVSIGTTLPELATSVAAVRQKNPDIAIGNVVGSVVFNVFGILGVSALIAPIPFDGQLNFDVFVMIAATLLLFLSLFLGRKHVVERWQGALFVACYLSYLAYLIYRG